MRFRLAPVDAYGLLVVPTSDLSLYQADAADIRFVCAKRRSGPFVGEWLTHVVVSFEISSSPASFDPALDRVDVAVHVVTAEICASKMRFAGETRRRFRMGFSCSGNADDPVLWPQRFETVKALHFAFAFDLDGKV